MNIKFLQNYLLTVALSILTIVLMGCPPKEIKKEEPAQPPQAAPPPEFHKTGSADMFFRAASIDLKSFPRKIEKKDIERFAAKMKKERIDIIAVQTIARYPGLKDRIDVFEELGRQTDMYKIFGESITLSGRQTGNAVFSSYPIRSNDNITYNHLKSMNFESALFAYIDAGTRPIYIVSTRVPDKITEAEVRSCLKTLIAQKRNYEDTPVEIFGNIFKPQNLQIVDDLQEPIEYNVVNYEQGVEAQKFPFWISSGDLQVMSSGILPTDLGLTLIAEFKLLGQKTKQ